MWWPAIGRCYVGALGSCLFNNVTLMPPVNDFAELPATLVCELGWLVGIHFRRIGL